MNKRQVSDRIVWTILLLVSGWFVSGMARADPPAFPLMVSIHELIARPADFNGKRVIVSGVLSVAFEDNSLYVDGEAFKFVWIPDSLHLDLSSKQEAEFGRHRGKRVTVEGVFAPSKRVPGELQNFGRLHSITVVRALEERSR